jgi:hypothetical protein
MRTRTLTGLTAALAAGGLTSAAIGMHVTHTTLPVIGGLALILAAAPAAVAAHGHQAAAATEQQLAAEHTAGYRQGLTHAALGLLTTSSTRMDVTDERTPE